MSDPSNEEKDEKDEEAPSGPPPASTPLASDEPSGSTRSPSNRNERDSGSSGAASKPRSSSLPIPLDTFATEEEAWGHPTFARDFPRHPEIDRLVTAFARGDYLTVRERAPKLAREAADAKVKRAAEMLRERIEPDRSSKVLFLLAGLLLAFLTVWWVAHDGPEDKVAPKTQTP